MIALAAALLTITPQASGATPPVFIPERALVVARSPGERAARPGIHRARVDEELPLFAVVEGTLGDVRVVISEAESLVLDGRRVPSTRLVRPATSHGIELRWLKVQPTGDSYNNTEGGFHWDEISYLEQPVSEWGTSWRRAADARPLPPYADDHGGAGTMAFKIEVRVGALSVASAGAAPRYRGGLGDEVTRVALRRDDSYVGRLTELFNTPYIWGSAGTPPRVHQAERLIGSDCADFIVYGARRLGRPLPYRSTWQLAEMARQIARGTEVDAVGRFVDSTGAPLKIGPAAIHVGDLLLFPRHVGALVEDRAPIGVLDVNDVMIHTYWAPPAEQPIAETAYSDSSVQVLRW